MSEFILGVVNINRGKKFLRSLLAVNELTQYKFGHTKVQTTEISAIISSPLDFLISRNNI